MQQTVAAEQENIFKNCQRTQETSVQMQHAGKPLPMEDPDFLRIYALLLPFPVSSLVVLSQSSRVQRNSDIHQSMDGNTTVG